MLRIRNYFIAFAVVFAISSAYAVIGVQDAKAQSTMGDLIQRIEALESKGGGSNVTAGKIKGLKIGFSIRHRAELRDDNSGNKNSATSDFTLQRMRLNLDANVNKNVRGYVQLQDVRTWGAEQSTAGNLARVDLIQGYVDLRNLGDVSSALENVSVRLGRWQAWYGNHRLIGHLNWANEARGFDGTRVRYDNKKNARIDLFAFTIQEDQTGGVSGEGSGSVAAPGSGTDQDEYLWGMYSQFKPASGFIVEPYLIIRNRSRDADGDRSAAANAGEQRYTYGARIAGKKVPSLPGVDFTLEQAWQSGKTEATSYRSTSIDAFAGAWGVGYTFSNVGWSPRIGYQFAYASGDDDTLDRDDESFDAIYPTGHARMGYLDFHSWQNIEAHKIEFSAKPTKKLLLKADMWIFEANEENDAWYTVGGGARTGNSAAEAKNATTNRDDEYGSELDLTVKYKFLKNFGITAGYSHYFTGDFIEDSVNGGTGRAVGGPGTSEDSDTDWFYLQTMMKF